jgi:hypothetical protein
MNLELPEGTHVQILIAPTAAAPMLLEPQPTASAVPAPPRSRHRVLKGAAVLALIGLAFLAGERVNPQSRAVPVAQAQTDPVPSSPPPPNGIPPAFRQQLQTPPTMTPAPGAAAPAAKVGEDGFGLEN